MSDEKEKWEPCPRCGSKSVNSRGGCFFGLVGFALIGVSIWLLFIPPVGIIGIILGLGLLLFAPFAGGMLQCDDCNKSWKYPAEENEYRKKDIEN